MRSVVVVLPASICAMMPMFRYRSRGVVRAMKATPRTPCEAGALKKIVFGRGLLRLPAVVREGLVRIGHAMRILPPLDRGAAVVGGVEQLPRKPLLHRVFRAPARARNEPPDGQRLAAVGPHFDRHLIGGAADAARAHLDGW